MKHIDGKLYGNICPHFIRAWTTYLHGPRTDKMGAGANFICAVLQIERSVNGPSAN